jgi:acetyl esterase/lipase
VSSLGATTDIKALREMLRQRKLALTASASSTAASSVSETDHLVKTRDGAEITIRVYRDANVIGGPVMVMLHGGGWILGGLENEALLCRKWCEGFGGVSINVEYRLAPEFKFPTPVYDCYDAVKWTAAHPELHGGDLAQGFVVAGVSAGANMACVVSHLARDEGMTPPLTGVYLSIPSLLAPEAVPTKWKAEYKSREENKNAPVLNEGAMALFRSQFLPRFVSFT